MPRFVGEENDPIRYCVGIDREGFCYHIPAVTFCTFHEASDLARQLYKAFYHEEPQISNRIGKYLKFNADCWDDTPMFYVWNHTDNTTVQPEHIRSTDADAEEIIGAYYNEYWRVTGVLHEYLAEPQPDAETEARH